MRDRVEAAKASGSALTFAGIAKAMRIQRSYLSQILAGNNTPNADQMYLAAGALGLPDEERGYLLLLLEIDRCQLAARRIELMAARDESRTAHTRSEDYLPGPAAPAANSANDDYFQDPLTTLVHVLLMIPAYRREPASLARKLGLPKERLDSVIGTLERCGMLTATAQGLTVRPQSLHLSRTSPLSSYHGAYFRLRGIDELQQRRDPHGYFFTTTIAATAATRERIRLAFLALLREASQWVQEAAEEEAFQLNFDLFRH